MSKIEGLIDLMEKEVQHLKECDNQVMRAYVSGRMMALVEAMKIEVSPDRATRK